MTDVQENIIEDEDGPVLEDPVEEEDVADSIEKDESDDDDESDEDDEDDDDDLPWYKDEYFWQRSLIIIYNCNIITNNHTRY